MARKVRRSVLHCSDEMVCDNLPICHNTSPLPDIRDEQSMKAGIAGPKVLEFREEYLILCAHNFRRTSTHIYVSENNTT